MKNSKSRESVHSQSSRRSKVSIRSERDRWKSAVSNISLRQQKSSLSRNSRMSKSETSISSRSRPMKNNSRISKTVSNMSNASIRSMKLKSNQISRTSNFDKYNQKVKKSLKCQLGQGFSKTTEASRALLEAAKNNKVDVEKTEEELLREKAEKELERKWAEEEKERQKRKDLEMERFELEDERRYEIKKILENRPFWKKGMFKVRVQQVLFVGIILVYAAIMSSINSFVDHSEGGFDKTLVINPVLSIILIVILYYFYQKIVADTIAVAKEERKIVQEYVHNNEV